MESSFVAGTRMNHVNSSPMTPWTVTTRLDLLQAEHPFLKFLATEMFWIFKNIGIHMRLLWTRTCAGTHNLLSFMCACIGSLQVTLLFDLTFTQTVTHCEMRCGILHMWCHVKHAKSFRFWSILNLGFLDSRRQPIQILLTCRGTEKGSYYRHLGNASEKTFLEKFPCKLGHRVLLHPGRMHFLVFLFYSNDYFDRSQIGISRALIPTDLTAY